MAHAISGLYPGEITTMQGYLVNVSKPDGFHWNTSLTRTDTGQYFIRYLAPGAKVGSSEPYLTIGTYPLANAYETTRRLSAAKTSVRVIIPGSGLAFYEKDRPTNFYLAYPGAPYQVEVYDPSAAQALQLVKAGRIVAVH